MPVLSATECVSPAFRHTTRQMFQPFRFGFWWRIALLGLLTGEMTAGGGGGGANFPSNFPKGGHAGGGGWGTHPPFPWHPEWFTPAHILQLALEIAVIAIVVTLVFVYINSILRFVLFDAVLNGDARIAAGWRKWRAIGRDFFTWQLFLTLLGWCVVIVCVLVPLLLLFPTHIGFWHIDATAILALALGFLAMMAASIALLIVAVLAKDFIVPMMALEHITWQEGWRRFRDIARGHASEYVIYFLIKIVLRIAAGIAHGIVMFFFGLLLAVPAVIAVIAGVAIGVGASLVVKAILITLAILGGLIFLAVIVAISAFVAAPISFFFPSYAIYFFAGRYAPLGHIVFPEPPPPPPILSGEVPPIPA